MAAPPPGFFGEAGLRPRPLFRLSITGQEGMILWLNRNHAMNQVRAGLIKPAPTRPARRWRQEPETREGKA